MLGVLLGSLLAALRLRRDLVLESLALRQQLAIYKHELPRPKMQPLDRAFWALLSRIWARWREALCIVTPATVMRWHRAGFSRFWAWRSKRLGGRPPVGDAVCDAVRRLARENPLWGAPRIHGELRMLGFEVAERTVARYLPKRSKPTSPTWRSFLRNHAKGLVAIDFFTVPSATFRLLRVLVVLDVATRRILHFNVTTHPTAQWTARQIVQAFDFADLPRRIIRDRDGCYGVAFSRAWRGSESRRF